MFAGLLTISVCMYWGASQRHCVGLMRETMLQTFGGDTAFTVKIAGAFKIETRRGKKWDLNTWARERNGLKLALTFATPTDDTAEMGSSDKKDLHKKWLRVCLLIGANSDLHDVLRSNWQIGLSSGARFLDVGKTVFEKGVTVVVLEICLSGKALIEVECNLETVYDGGESALTQMKQPFYTILLTDKGWYFQRHRNPQNFCVCV